MNNILINFQFINDLTIFDYLFFFAILFCNKYNANKLT